MKILLLDDDKFLLKALHNVLVDRGHEAECANCAKDALGVVQEGEFDFVLVDYKMPENDGVWFMQNAKIPRGTKALLMTAFVDRGVINRMFSLGACGYLIKPFDGDELIRHLEFHGEKREV